MGGGVGWSGGGGVEGVDDGDRDLHAAEAEAVAADEVVGLGLVEGDEVLAGAPVAGEAVHGAVVVPRLVHLEHVVHVLLVPEGCGHQKVRVGMETGGGYEGLTDEVVDVEGLVVGPQRVVDVGVPPEVAADDVVGGGDEGHGDGEEEEEEAELTETH